jgi:hypothetical protein
MIRAQQPLDVVNLYSHSLRLHDITAYTTNQYTFGINNAHIITNRQIERGEASEDPKVS